ncbi:MAG TPA: YceD family protein [Verrucomicrobiae bacterium]|nr:YceD family protein [Verrucomicrobiae bacterium]
MPLLVNLRHLEKNDCKLKGELAVEELDIDTGDEMVQLAKPLRYQLEVQKMADALLARGKLVLPLACQCVRCLKAFEFKLELPDWACHIPLVGEEKAPIISDSVDLTPFLREDILLELPQHPLCKPDCGGLKKPKAGKSKKTDPGAPEASAWSELDKLKF